jgi:hypothetical protein
MFTNIIGCYLVITQLSAPLIMRPPELQSRINTCVFVAEEVTKQAQEDYMSVMLSVAWQESGFKMEAKGRWLCTGKGELKFSKKGKPSCTSGKLTRARGPMQVLPVYHCKGEPKGKCNYVKVSVRLLGNLVENYGLTKGLEIYAGGFSRSKASKNYARMTIWRSKKIYKTLKKIGWTQKNPL